MFVKTIFH